MSNEIAKPIDPMAEFKAKLGERVREDIRNLLPEDAVSALVQEAVRETFFKPRRIDEGYGRFKETPSWFVEEVAEVAKPLLQKAVGEYVAANKATIETALAAYLSPQNLTLLAVGSLSSDIRAALSDLANAVRQRSF